MLLCTASPYYNAAQTSFTVAICNQTPQKKRVRPGCHALAVIHCHYAHCSICLVLHGKAVTAKSIACNNLLPTLFPNHYLPILFLAYAYFACGQNLVRAQLVGPDRVSYRRSAWELHSITMYIKLSSACYSLSVLHRLPKLYVIVFIMFPGLLGGLTAGCGLPNLLWPA